MTAKVLTEAQTVVKTKAKTKRKADLPSPFQRILPDSLKVGKDKLMLRLDFYGEAIMMQDFRAEGGEFRMVSAHDLAHAITSELPYATGILPEGTLWWSNSNAGAVTAIWVPPGVRRLALQKEALKAPERLDVPLPGLIFLCRPGRPPHIYAASKRPTGPKDKVYKAPLANTYDDGRTCPGNHRYPDDVGEIPSSFLVSFFTMEVQGQCSKKHPDDVTKMWRELHGKNEWPLDDLVYHGTVNDLMRMRL